MSKETFDDYVNAKSLEELRILYKEALREEVEIEDHAKRLATKVLPQEEIDGDKYCYPDVIYIVERLINKIEVLNKIINKNL